MAASKAELWDQLAKAIKIDDEFFKFCTENSPNFLNMLDILQQSYEGEQHIENTGTQFKSFRDSLSSLAGVKTRLTPVLLELGRVGYNSVASQINAVLEDIQIGMVAASETVRYRNWTHGVVVPSGENIGTGTVYRIIKNKNNQTIEGGNYVGGDLKIKVITDKNLGATSGREIAQIYGCGKIPIDKISLGTAPGGVSNLTAYRSSDGLLNNSSFDFFSASEFSPWVLTSTGDAAQETAIYFRKTPGADSGKACEFTDNNDIEQHITNAAALFDVSKPVFLILRYYRKDSCDGALTLRLGSKTVAVADLTGQADATWHDLVLGNVGSEGWYDNFKEDDSGDGVRIKISLASRTIGSLLLDEVLLVQPIKYNALWYMFIAGAADFLKEDHFTFTDSVINTGRIQSTMARLFGIDFPWATSGETYADA